MYSVQRVYDYHGQQPAILTDRLWPRGVRKDKLKGCNGVKLFHLPHHCDSGFTKIVNSDIKNFAVVIG